MCACCWKLALFILFFNQFIMQLQIFYICSILALIILWLLYKYLKRHTKVTKTNEDTDLVEFPEVYPAPSYPADLSAIEKANRVLKHKEEVETCLKADLCPVCGASLAHKNDNVAFNITYCSKDKSHYCRHDYMDYDNDDSW